MITEFLSVYSRFCSKILRIWQKFAVEYCSYKGLTPILPLRLKLYSSCPVEYCSYKGLTLNKLFIFFLCHILLNIVLIKD